MEIPNPKTSIPKLPDDVIIEILTWLPVQSLLKFRCVCKSWLSLISSQQFVKKHLRNSKEDSNFRHHRVMLNCFGNLKQLSVNSLLHEPIVDAFDTDDFVRLSKGLFGVVGSCDGLICLAMCKKDLILWNPPTRIGKKLPDFGLDIEFGGGSFDGIGFCKTSDDYKVVIFSKLSEVIVKVYSLKSDKWKRIEDFKGRWQMHVAMFAHGKLHGIAKTVLESESGWDIFSLNLETEEYGIFQIPNYVQSCLSPMMGASQGCLYVLCSHLTATDVWIVDYYGVEKQTWTKVVSIPYIFDDFFMDTYKKVLYVLKNGEVLLLSDSKLVVIFDAKVCSFRYPEVRNADIFAACNYFESLVSPVGW